jgi:hypothetical protein
MLISDASEKGWGAYIEFGTRWWHTYGFFYPSDGLTSSNQRETAAVLRALLYFKPILLCIRKHGLTIRSDNAVTVYNLQRQGAGVALLNMTRSIFSLLQELDIRLHVMHIPGIENVLTDELSRIDSSGDYELRTDVYNHATRILRVTPTVDLFAASHNHKRPSFVAWTAAQAAGAAAQDAFALERWDRGLPYIFPPLQLLNEVLRRISDQKVRAVVVVPKWPSQPWWNLFRPMASSILELGREKEVPLPGPAMRNSPTIKKLPPGTFLMALLNHTPSENTVNV